MEDSEIVARYLQRDETALSLTAEKYGPRLQALSFGIVCDRQAAEECENDTYLAAWNAIPPHEPRSYLFAFLARITRHLSLNLCRDRARLKRSAFLTELSAELEQCLPAPDDVACRVEDRLFAGILNRCLGKMGAEKRNIFLRRYWYLDSIAAIAERFALSESKVKTTLFRCRKLLRAELEQEGYEL